MKLRTTTPASISFIRKVSLILVGLSLLVLVPIQLMNSDTKACSTIAECDAEINARNQEIDEYNKKLSQLSGEAQTLQNTIERLRIEGSAIQSQVDISQNKYDKLVQQISDTEKRIKDNQDALGSILADLYVDDKITPIEMLASSKTVSDFIDKQEYRSSVRNQLTSTISEIKVLKESLVAQKTDVERVLNDQKSQRRALAQNESQQRQLLNENSNNANSYEQLKGALNAQIAQLRSDRIGLNTPKGYNGTTSIGPVNFRNWSGNIYCGGGYEYCQYKLDDYVWDNWGLHLAGECVHYTAWALTNRGYYIPYNAFSLDNGYGGGNANKWVAVATGEGFASLVSNPQKDDLAYMATGGVGHVGIVEHNYGDGWVRISQYNYAVYDETPMYSTIDLQITSGTQFLRFHK